MACYSFDATRKHRFYAHLGYLVNEKNTFRQFVKLQFLKNLLHYWHYILWVTPVTDTRNSREATVHKIRLPDC